MLNTLVFRFFLLLCATLGTVHVLSEEARAQQAATDLPPAKVQEFLNLLGDPEVKTWLEKKAPDAPGQPDLSAADTISSVEAIVRDRIGALAIALPRVPSELANAAAVISRDANSGRPGTILAILFVLIAVGSGTEWLVRRVLDMARDRNAGRETDLLGNTGAAVATEIVALLVFSLASVGAFLAFDWPPLLRKMVLTFLVAAIAFRLARTITRLIFEHSRASRAGFPEPKSPASESTTASFWRRRVGVLSGLFLFGWAIVSLMPALAVSLEVSRVAAILFGLGITAGAIEIAWRRPTVAKSGSTTGRTLITVFLIVLWVLWVAGMFGLLWLGILALLLPKFVGGVGDVADSFVRRGENVGTAGVIMNVLIIRGARALVIAAAAVWLGHVVRLNPIFSIDGESYAILLKGLIQGVIIVLIADLLWQISKALIAHQLEVPKGDDQERLARQGRLRTLLPIFRNALAVFIVTVAVLTILSGLGLQIAPLIAGAGIFGVAIGFGSQTLVKDVLSGMFYMMDDAFRVGEYILSGSYQGMVESFSLRSVRLRHYRGPVFTVPFGQLGAVQNLSRDWAIEKMKISVTHDSDIELAKKLVKQIGKELAEDPEFAADTIEPLKMQGIDSFGDFAIILKLKLMTKPGTQFGMKRRALMMIKKAFEENNIKIAYPTVHVDGGSESAAASQQVLQKMKEKAEAAE